MDNTDNTIVNRLLEKRHLLRKSGKYQEADEIRQQLNKLGFNVTDNPDQSDVVKINNISKLPNNQFLVLFGSGETAPISQQSHEYIFKRISCDPINIVIITTPAGFQPNVNYVHQKIADFFQHSLQNFHPQISIIFANNRNLANNEEIIGPVDHADYIFMGPGSPTYAVDHLKNTALYRKILQKISSGTSIGLASSAAIAMSYKTLPVYEIYKVGAGLSWKEGINFYSQIYKQLTIIPHFNNGEGGANLDTSCCFIGYERFSKLRKILPKNETMWGIDEQTSIIIDLKTKETKIIGKGNLHEI